MSNLHSLAVYGVSQIFPPSQFPHGRCSSNCRACDLYQQIRTDPDSCNKLNETNVAPEASLESIAEYDMAICRVSVSANRMHTLIDRVSETTQCRLGNSLEALQVLIEDHERQVVEMEEILEPIRQAFEHQKAIQALRQRREALEDLLTATALQRHEDDIFSDALGSFASILQVQDQKRT